MRKGYEIAYEIETDHCVIDFSDFDDESCDCEVEVDDCPLLPPCDDCPNEAPCDDEWEEYLVDEASDPWAVPA